MKLNTILTLAVALCAVAAVSQDKPQPRAHSVIMLQARAFYWREPQNAPPDPQGNRADTYQWGGFSVYNVDASMDLRTNGLPLPGYLLVPTLSDPYSVNADWTNSLAVRSAQILDAGYRLQSQAGDAYSVTATFVK